MEVACSVPLPSSAGEVGESEFCEDEPGEGAIDAPLEAGQEAENPERNSLGFRFVSLARNDLKI
jgi:hypothetical protein